MPTLDTVRPCATRKNPVPPKRPAYSAVASGVEEWRSSISRIARRRRRQQASKGKSPSDRIVRANSRLSNLGAAQPAHQEQGGKQEQRSGDGQVPVQAMAPQGSDVRSAECGEHHGANSLPAPGKDEDDGVDRDRDQMDGEVSELQPDASLPAER